MVSVPVVASSGEFSTPCKTVFHLIEKDLEKRYKTPFYFAVISDPGCGSVGGGNTNV